MKTIYRYPLNFKMGENGEVIAEFKAPVRLYDRTKDQILKVDIIRDIPSVWVTVDTELPEVNVLIHCYGTGWKMPDNMDYRNYIGSIIINNAEIYHCFLDEQFLH